MPSIALVYDVLSCRGLLNGRLRCHYLFILAELPSYASRFEGRSADPAVEVRGSLLEPLQKVVVLIQSTKVSATLIAQSLAGISRRRLNSATQGPSAN